MNLTAILIITIIGYVLFSSCHKVYKAYFSALSKLPGPKRHVLAPLLSIFPILAKGQGHLAAEHMFEKYKTRIVRTGDSVSISDPDEVQRILRKEEWPKAPVVYKRLEFTDGVDNLVSASDKTVHKRLRRLCSPAFAVKVLNQMETYFKAISNQFEDMIKDGLKNGQEKTVLDLARCIQGLSTDIIGEVAFGHSFDMLHQGSHPMHDARTLLLKVKNAKGILPIIQHLPLVRKSESYLQRYLDAVVENRRKAIQEAQDEGKEWTRRDILQFMLDYVDTDGERLCDEEIKDMALLFNIAGSETTANSMIWTVILLSQHPEVAEKLYEELREQFPNGLEEDLKPEELKSLPYLNAVLKESMRLYPVFGGGFARSAPHDTTVCGYKIPQGTTVYIALWRLHRDPELWQRSTEFWPERWLLSDDDPLNASQPPAVNRNAFLPFSAGTRNCIGKDFAWLEMRHVLGTFYRRYDLQVLPNQDLTPAAWVSLQLVTNHLNVSFTPRKE